jgi:hypothetical protein
LVAGGEQAKENTQNQPWIGFGSALSNGWPLASCASEDKPAVIYAGHEIPAI